MVSYLLGNYMVESGLMSRTQLKEVLSVQEKIRVKLGLIAVSEGMLTLEQSDEVNRLQQVMDKRFGDIAVEKGYLTDAQVEKLLKMQGNEYLTFVQTLVDENIISMEQIQAILKDYQEKNGFTNTEMEIIKNGDPEKVVALFMPSGTEEYQEPVAVALKAMIRCIDRHTYPMYGKLVNDFAANMPVTQEADGTQYWKVGFSDENQGLCAIASTFAKEEFKEVNEDVQDAVGEFLNCVNGLFATALSNRNITLELMPPILGESGQVEGQDILLMPFGIGDAVVNLIVTNKKSWR